MTFAMKGALALEHSKDIAIIKDFGILYRTFLSFASKSISATDLSFSDSIFLINIGECEGISQEQISSALAIDQAAIARSVKSMSEKGYVRADKSQMDRRLKALTLTDAGRELYQHLSGLHAEWLRQVLANLNPDEIRKFSETIHNISDRAKAVVKS